MNIIEMFMFKIYCKKKIFLLSFMQYEWWISRSFFNDLLF
jgi:hypothetical protein